MTGTKWAGLALRKLFYVGQVHFKGHMATFEGQLAHIIKFNSLQIHSFLHLLVPVPFEKGTGTPQARNGQDMHSKNNYKCDRGTLKVIWQPLKVIGVISSCFVYKNPLIFAYTHAIDF
jgi:hypothetical protein